MKKGFIFLAVLGLFIFASPKIVDAAAQPCHTAVMTCPDGTQHTVYYCGAGDWWAWADILCDVPIS